MCAVNESMPKGPKLYSFSLGEKVVENFTNHKHRPLGIASMFKEYKLVNINLL